MKVLVTGASGGLGDLIVERLLKLGHKVIASSRDIDKARNCVWFDKVIYKNYTIGKNHDTDLYQYFEQPDLLIHLAWEKLNEYKNPEHLTNILESHKAFLQNLVTNGLKDMSVIGTCYEYGVIEGELEENMRSTATLPYPQAKNLLREFLEEQQKTHHFMLKWIRVFYVFGAVKGRKNLFALLEEAIENNVNFFNMSGGEQIRDFLSPARISEIIVSVSLQTKVLGIVNCCSGKPVKLKDFVLQYLEDKRYKMKLNLGFYPYADYEPMNSWGSIAKLQAALATNST